jgi:transposase
MESTGIFWKPIYEVLEEVDGINLCLVNAQHMRNVPGRKTGVADAEWIASLYMCGLLDKSFVPEKGIRDLREYTRFYVKLIQERNRTLNRIEKFLQTHGFKLSSVLSSISGVSSMRILEKLSEQGEVNASDVRACLNGGVKKSSEEIAYAINGKLSYVPRTLLKLMLDTLRSIDNQISTFYKSMMEVTTPYMTYVRLIDTIPGIDILSAIYIIAEIGVDMSAFAKEGNLISWAGLSPKNDMSAGVVKSRKISKGNTYVKSILCQCAWGAVKTRNTRFSNWYWRNVKRLGEKKAIIAVARKLLCYIYSMMSTGELYNHQLDKADTEKYNAYKLESAKQKISKLESKVRTTAAINDNCSEIVTVVSKSSKILGTDKREEEKSPKSLLSKPDPSIKLKKRGRPKKIPQPIAV